MNEMEESGTDVAGDDCSEEDACYFGRMDDPAASSILKGPYGDEMEMYIRDNIIKDATYHAEGRSHTRVCALAVAKRAEGKSVMEPLASAFPRKSATALYSPSAPCNGPLRITS